MLDPALAPVPADHPQFQPGGFPVAGRFLQMLPEGFQIGRVDDLLQKTGVGTELLGGVAGQPLAGGGHVGKPFFVFEVFPAERGVDNELEHG